MEYVSRFECVTCGRDVPPPESAGTCPHCGDPFSVLEIVYDMDRVRGSMTRQALARRPLNHWRYGELLPVIPNELMRRWPVGWTPIIDAPRLARWAGVARLRLKDEGRNPTASMKDRASSVGVAHAVAGGATHVACASTGNAASSLAGYAAMAGIEATIFVPQRAPEPKIAQLLVYGAHVKRVRGTYAQAYELCNRMCDTHGWYNRNCAINPYLVEGKKTCGLEIAEQTSGDEPGWVVVSVGDGCTIAGIAKGLMQMHELGFLGRVPRVLGVQASGVAPIASAFETGDLPKAISGTTMADSIDVPVPRNWRKAIRWVRRCDGAYVTVSDEQIGQAMMATGRQAGVFAEPAAATAVAGVAHAVSTRIIPSDADVLAVITGSGLKDIASASCLAGAPVDVDPT